MANSLQDLGDVPTHYADCCVAISRPLIQAIADRLPRSPATVLSIGSGSGLLEKYLLLQGQIDGQAPLDLYGIEVPSCINEHLPAERLLRVASTTSLYSDSMFASALIFVYPRQVSLVIQYLNLCLSGALEVTIWLGHRSDWHDMEKFMSAAFATVEYFDKPGVAEYELLVIAKEPRIARNNVTGDS